MASVVYTPAKTFFFRGQLDLREAGNDIRALLVMTSTTVHTQEDVATIAGFTTLDEMNGAGYVRKALANQAVNEDDPNNRGEFDADDVTWSALGAGTRSVKGVLIFKFVATDADHIPIAFFEFPTAYPATGIDFTLSWNAEGILQAT